VSLGDYGLGQGELCKETVKSIEDQLQARVEKKLEELTDFAGHLFTQNSSV
jgi:hypothetical protein